MQTQYSDGNSKLKVAPEVKEEVAPQVNEKGKEEVATQVDEKGNEEVATQVDEKVKEEQVDEKRKEEEVANLADEKVVKEAAQTSEEKQRDEEMKEDESACLHGHYRTLTLIAYKYIAWHEIYMNETIQKWRISPKIVFPPPLSKYIYTLDTCVINN